jgi:hypothetical protein
LRFAGVIRPQQPKALRPTFRENVGLSAFHMPASQLDTKNHTVDDKHRIWMVHVSGSPGPNKEYTDFNEAVEDAKHLSRKTRKKTTVLESIGVFISRTRKPQPDTSSV